ncbi:hypothetical protein ACH5RR_038021 [Cinchona calisaya]|uniref:F-box domain-containing protein n=1 Tax=Cinchona calisaya TaxID=153742 RepID=A0ABD2YAV8_9GENT
MTGNNNSVAAKSSMPKIIDRCNRIMKSPTPCPCPCPCPTAEVMDFENDGYLPDWFLMEVLSRLPINFAIRLKCVSRKWLSLISDPAFVHFYVSRASAVPRCPLVFLFKKLYVEGSTLTYFPENKLTEIIFSPPNPTSPAYHVLPLPNSQEAKGKTYFINAVDNGLVLYRGSEIWWDARDYFSEYYICDPITKQWFPLPEPKYASKRVSLGFITHVEAGILTSYKVVLIHCCRHIRHFLKFEVFSSETGEWVEHTVHSQCGMMVCRFRNPVLLSGNLHWIDFQSGIVAYDPYDCPDKFRLIGFPYDVDKKHPSVRCGVHGVHQGHLKYFEVTPLHHRDACSDFKIWVLEDYNSDGWCLQHIVRNEDILVDSRLHHAVPGTIFIAFHPYDADIVYLEWHDDLVTYNTKTRRVEALGIPFLPESDITYFLDLECWLCFPLVLPPWPIYIPPSLIPPMHIK